MFSEGIRLSGRIFVWAVALNFLWEMVQAFAYTGMPPSTFEATLMCGQASLVDAVMVLAIYWAGVVVFTQINWVKRPRLPGYFFTVAAGLLVSIIVELNAVYRLEKWGYRPMMPILGPLGVGVFPVLQMVLLPPLIFFFLACGRRVGEGK
ncbi:MAG: hypothetical protein ACREJ6_03580 [Candidatus Methylomirabilis sp.]